MSTLLQHILTYLAGRTLLKYRPFIVGVTGSVGKTSTKEAIFAVLSQKYLVRKSERNYNTEIGVPITILGISHYGKNIFAWLFVIAQSCVGLFRRDPNYPDYLVLEMGADHPGDIAHLVALAPPLVGVITAIGAVPVHVEFFSGPEELAHEKAKLIEALPPEGYAVLNLDDEPVAGIKSRARGHILSYGFGKAADVRISQYRLASHGIGFSLQHGDRAIYIQLKNTFGEHQAYAAAAACAVGLVLNMNLDEIARGLATYEAPPGRLKILRGNKGSLILDDTYNASPQAVEAALMVLREFRAKRRIAVLGDMLELGKFTEDAHREIGNEVAKSADVFIAVGERMKFAVEESMKPGLNRRAFAENRVFWFSDSTEAGRMLDGILQPGDVVLIKGSQSMRMERAVKEVMAEPERAKDLLIRQTVDWERRAKQ